MKSSERYAFVPITGAGLLLDLETGGLFKLNETAAFIWGLRTSGGDSADIACALASHYGIEEVRARLDVESALALALPVPVPTLSTNDFRYQASERGYIQSFRGDPVLEVDAQGDRLRAIDWTSNRPRHLRDCVRAIAPKILSLRGRTVLHASAVMVAERLLVFPGPSGAGKTTTARALVEQGAIAVSEDKVLVCIEGGTPHSWVLGERTVDEWVTRATLALVADRESSCEGLDEATRGETVPISEIGFIDARRRSTDGYVARRLGEIETTSELFRWTFLGSEGATNWRRDLEAATAIASFAASYELMMPHDLTGLSTAAAMLLKAGSLAS